MSQKLILEWYKLNYETLKDIGSRKAYKYFANDHPGVYSVGGFRRIYEDVKFGRITEEKFSDVETKKVDHIEDLADATPNFDTRFFESNMIEFPTSWAESYVPFSVTDCKNLGICSDIHIPYHDPIALAACFSAWYSKARC